MKRKRQHALGVLLVAGLFAALPSAALGASSGHPKVTLDRLDLDRVPPALVDEAFLRKVLAREARHADWGAGRGSRVEYRFQLDELTVVEEGSVLRVVCSASGQLPKGRRAKSHLSFGGAPKDREKLLHHVLEIVAGDVVGRLADMERRRRSAR